MTLRAPLLSMILLVACTGDDIGPNGQFGEEDALECAPTTREVVELDEVVTLSSGRSDTRNADAASVIAAHEGEHTSTLTWLKTDEQTSITATLTATGTAERVVWEPTDPSLAEYEPCPTLLHLGFDVLVTTDDGRLDESFEIEATSSGDRLYVSHELATLQGTLRPQELAPGDEPVDADAVSVHLSLGTTFSGQIVPLRTDVPGEDVQPLGTWPGELEED